MLSRLADAFAPHYCVSCERIGEILCTCCQYDIIEDAQITCIVCKSPSRDEGICRNCRSHVAYQRAWAATERDAVITRVIDEYKSHHNATALSLCATLLDASLPVLPTTTIVVPVPTISLHIRQRGFAHAEIIATQFAMMRGLTYRQYVTRRANYVQRGSTRRQRLDQARHSYQCTERLPDVPYLVIDDVVATGATLDAVARTLVANGAKDVYVAVVARQPRDDITK